MAAGAVPNYGVLGGNITEMTLGMNQPDRDVIVNNPIAAAIAAETASYNNIRNFVCILNCGSNPHFTSMLLNPQLCYSCAVHIFVYVITAVC